MTTHVTNSRTSKSLPIPATVECSVQVCVCPVSLAPRLYKLCTPSNQSAELDVCFESVSLAYSCAVVPVMRHICGLRDVMSD